jgi:bifunctional non-homologous end joining protein LigD
MMTGSAQASRLIEVLSQAESEATLRLGKYRVKVTSLDKKLWPGARPAVTKRGYLQYLASVSEALLRQVKDRPVFVVRSPDGIDGSHFFQKHFPDAEGFVRTLAIWTEEEGKPTQYLLPSNLATLLWLGQRAAVELHAWHSSVTRGSDGGQLGTGYAISAAALDRSRLNFPDFLVVDLDSYIYSGKERKGEEPELHRKGFEAVRDVALEVREAATSLGLEPFVKTSGKTGLHLFFPIIRDFTFDEVRRMAEALGAFVARRMPKRVTLEWSVENRAGKVFFDYNQNVRGKSLAAAYSVRRHPAATVSTPVTWDELAHIYPTDFTVHTVPERLASTGDPWANILDTRHDLATALGLASADVPT